MQYKVYIATLYLFFGIRKNVEALDYLNAYRKMTAPLGSVRAVGAVKKTTRIVDPTSNCHKEIHLPNNKIKTQHV